MNEVNLVTFFDEGGCASHVVKGQRNSEVLKLIDLKSFHYAFVNMIGGDFIIVENNKKFKYA